MRVIIVILVLIFAPFISKGQSGELCQVQVLHGDTIFSSFLPEIVVKGKPRSNVRYKRYQNSMTRLEYNVRKAYPYALIVARKVDEINAKLETMPLSRDRDKWLDDEYKKLFKEFKAPLMQLTYTQGRILVKLIDRETSTKAYTHIKNFRNGVSAVFWQSIALMFGNNLKATYDPLGEDAEIEEIVLKIRKELTRPKISLQFESILNC